MSNTQLYTVYMTSGDLFFQAFDAVKRGKKDRKRDASECPKDSYGFYYGYGKARVLRITDLDLETGITFVDPIIIPSRRLAQYLEQTGAYGNVDELLTNGTTGLHVHTPQGRFYAFNPAKDKIAHRPL